MAYKFKALAPPKSIEIEGLNIAVGLTPPEDTNKLWVQTSYITGVEIREDIRTTALPDALPATCVHLACAAIGTKIYILGTGQNRNDIWRFDTETETITTLPETLPYKVGYSSCAVVGTKIYLINGRGTSPKVTNGSRIDTIYCFDAETEKVKLLLSTGSRGSFGCSAAVGTFIYATGYRTSDDGSLNKNYINSTIYRFDTETETWGSYASMPMKNTSVGAASLGPNVYFFGGHSGSYSNNTVYCLDTETRTTSTVCYISNCIPSVAGMTGIGCVTIGDEIYLFGGAYSSNSTIFTPYNYVMRFNPTKSVKLNVMDFTMTTSKSYVGCAAVGSDVYIFGGNPSTTEYSGSKTIERIYTAPHLAHRKLQLCVQSGSMSKQYEGIDSVNILASDGVGIRYPIYGAFVGNAKGRGVPVKIAAYKDGEWKTI